MQTCVPPKGEQKAMVQTMFDAAVSESDADAISRAINDTVTAGLEVHALASLREKAVLERAAQQSQTTLMIARRLELAIADSDARNLTSLIHHAAAHGVDDELLGRAQARLAVVQEEIRLRARRAPDVIGQAEAKVAVLRAKNLRRQQEEALSNLACSTTGRDAEALESAIECAVASGLGEEDLRPARAKLAALRGSAKGEKQQAHTLKAAKTLLATQTSAGAEASPAANTLPAKVLPAKASPVAKTPMAKLQAQPSPVAKALPTPPAKAMPAKASEAAHIRAARF